MSKVSSHSLASRHRIGVTPPLEIANPPKYKNRDALWARIENGGPSRAPRDPRRRQRDANAPPARRPPPARPPLTSPAPPAPPTPRPTAPLPARKTLRARRPPPTARDRALLRAPHLHRHPRAAHRSRVRTRARPRAPPRATPASPDAWRAKHTASQRAVDAETPWAARRRGARVGPGVGGAASPSQPDWRMASPASSTTSKCSPLPGVTSPVPGAAAGRAGRCDATARGAARTHRMLGHLPPSPPPSAVFAVALCHMGLRRPPLLCAVTMGPHRVRLSCSVPAARSMFQPGEGGKLVSRRVHKGGEAR